MSEEVKAKTVQSEPAKTEQVQNTESKSTETAKAGKTYSEAEYNALKSQLETLKQSAKDNEDFKKKFEESEQARKAFEHKTRVSAYVKSLSLKDDIYEKHLENLIIEKGLKFENEKLIGGNDIISVFKEKYPHAFASGGNTPTASFTAPLNTKNVSVTIDDFRKMGIGDRIKLKSSNPELYKQFTGKK